MGPLSVGRRPRSTSGHFSEGGLLQLARLVCKVGERWSRRRGFNFNHPLNDRSVV